MNKVIATVSNKWRKARIYNAIIVITILLLLNLILLWLSVFNSINIGPVNFNAKLAAYSVTSWMLLVIIANQYKNILKFLFGNYPLIEFTDNKFIYMCGSIISDSISDIEVISLEGKNNIFIKYKDNKSILMSTMFAQEDANIILERMKHIVSLNIIE